MALRFPILVKARSTTTGTGTLNIDESVATVGYRTFTRAVTDLDLADGDQVAFVTRDTTVTNGPKLAELAVGTWNNTAKTLTRDTIYQPGATPVSWGAGTRDVVVVDNPIIFLLLAGGTMTGILKILLSGTIIAPAAETSLVVQRSSTTSTDCGVSVIAGTSGKSRVNLGDTADEKAIAIIGDNNINSIIFRTNGVDRQVIDSSGVLKVTVSGNSYDAFAGGGVIKWPFYTAAAPALWTKDSTNNDKALRVVSGTGGGSGGSRVLSSATVGGTSISIAQMPSHTHFMDQINGAQSGINSGVARNYTGTAPTYETSQTGGGDPHDHALALAYIDVIICSKN